MALPGPDLGGLEIFFNLRPSSAIDRFFCLCGEVNEFDGVLKLVSFLNIYDSYLRLFWGSFPSPHEVETPRKHDDASIELGMKIERVLRLWIKVSG